MDKHESISLTLEILDCKIREGIEAGELTKADIINIYMLLEKNQKNYEPMIEEVRLNFLHKLENSWLRNYSTEYELVSIFIMKILREENMKKEEIMKELKLSDIEYGRCLKKLRNIEAQ